MADSKQEDNNIRNIKLAIKSASTYLLIIGLVILVLSLISGVIGLLTPHWISNDVTRTSQGLFATCENTGAVSEMKCSWFGLQREAPDGGIMSACRGIMASGAAILFCCAIGSTTYCCNWKRRGACCSLTIAIGVLVSGVLILITLILFGIDNKNTIDTSDHALDWSFYISIISIIFCVATCVLFTLTAYGLRKTNPYVMKGSNGFTNGGSGVNGRNKGDSAAANGTSSIETKTTPV